MFSQDVICDNEKDNTWKWESTSFTPPSLEEIALLTASIPPIDMSKATIPLYQSSLSSYSNGLQLGSAPAKINAVNAIKVYHRLAQLDLDCVGDYTLKNNNITLYLAPIATVDFRKATIESVDYKSTYSQSLTNSRSVVLNILPQTFKKGAPLFQYKAGNTQYTYYLERDLVVSTNQCLKVRISPGEEDEYEPGSPTPPDPPTTVKISITTSTITEWVEGSSSVVPVE